MKKTANEEWTHYTPRLLQLRTMCTHSSSQIWHFVIHIYHQGSQALIGKTAWKQRTKLTNVPDRKFDDTNNDYGPLIL